MGTLPEIPGYSLTRHIGGGSYSQVYEGHPRTSRGQGWSFAPVAIKVLDSEVAKDPWVLECFRHEGEIGSAVRHPSLLAFFDRHLSREPYAHICELIDGSTLAELESPSVATSIAVLTQMAAALAAMHRAGFVHGDVKPGNIMLAASGRATLIDLGFAHRPGSLPSGECMAGTPNYLAPELCRKNYQDTPAADIFALGVTAFELLTGELPYPKLDETSEVLCQHRNEPPRSLKNSGLPLPNRIVNLVDRMLERNANQRPRVSQVVAELAALKPVRNRVA